MAIIRVTVRSNEWRVSTAPNHKGDVVERWRAGRTLVNVTHRFIRVRNRRFERGDEFEINGVNIGAPDKTPYPGCAEFVKVAEDSILRILVDEDGKVPDHLDGGEATAEPPAITLMETGWKNRSLWHFGLVIRGAPGPRVRISRSDYDGSPWVTHALPQTADGLMGFKSVVESDHAAVTVRFRFLDSHGRVAAEAQFHINRPVEAKRPKNEDWWESRILRPAVEQRGSAFPQHEIDAHIEADPALAAALKRGVPNDIHYAVGPTFHVQAVAAAGGFAVQWEEAGDDDIPHGRTPFYDAVRIYWRPTALRGSGLPWKASLESRHQRCDGKTPVTIPATGGKLDVLVQPHIYRPFRCLRPSVPVWVVPGPPPPSTGRITLTTTMHTFRHFPAVDVAAVKEAMSRYTAEPTAAEKLRMAVLGEGHAVTPRQMQDLFAAELPRFQWISDNFGSFSALPPDLWQDIIEATDTEALEYDPAWYSCADFSTDFKAAAARYGGKVINIWDFAGKHAYCCLPTLEDGKVVLRFFEPQTDEMVGPGADLYAQTGRGIVMAW